VTGAPDSHQLPRYALHRSALSPFPCWGWPVRKWLPGGISVVSADGDVYEVSNRVTPCRCGSSANKPFCDATHVSIE